MRFFGWLIKTIGKSSLSEIELIELVRKKFPDRLPPSKPEKYLQKFYREYVIETDGKLRLNAEGYKQLEIIMDSAPAVETPEEIQKQRIRSLLLKEKPVSKSLGMGLHNNIFYYGTKVYDEDGEPHDAIITSDKKIYVNWGSDNQIKNFGLFYRWPFFEGVLDMQWSNMGISKWLNENCEDITVEGAYKKILEKNIFYIDYHDQRWHKFVSLDILSTFFTECFGCKGRTLYSQEHGSGKTRQCELYKTMAFNSAMSIDWTESSIFRSIESTKATIIIDNFDDISEETRKAMMTVFRAYRKSKTVRTEGERRRQPMAFDLFTSVILNNLIGLDEVSEDRARKPKLLRSKNMEIVNRRIDQKNPEWQHLRDEFYICGLQNWKTVVETYEKMKEDRLVGRNLEVYEDILTLAKVISDELYEEMLGLIQAELEQKSIRELSRDYLYLGMKTILEILERERLAEKWIKVNDVVEEVARILWNPESKDFERKKRGIAIYLGKSFKNNTLFKGRMYHGTSEYLCELKNVLTNCDLKDFKDLVSTYSTLSTNPTLSTYSTNPQPTEQVEKVEKVE